MQSKFQIGDLVRIKPTSSLNPSTTGFVASLVANDKTSYFVHVKDRGIVAINQSQLTSNKAKF